MNELIIKHYLDGLKEGKILGTKCKNCGKVMTPQKPVCEKCGSTDLEEIEFKGEGTIRSFTIINVAPPQFTDKAPYVVVIVHLDEGPSIVGRLIGVDPTKPEKIKIGMRVKFNPLEEDGKVIVGFKEEI